MKGLTKSTAHEAFREVVGVSIGSDVCEHGDEVCVDGRGRGMHVDGALAGDLNVLSKFWPGVDQYIGARLILPLIGHEQ